MDAGNVIVKLKADIKNLQSNLTKAAGLFKSFERSATAPLRAVDRSIKGLFNIRNLAVAGTIAAITKIGATAEETENLFDTAFEGMSDSVRQWSENLAKDLKLSANGLRQNTANFKAFLDGLDMGADAATNMSKALTEMSLDLSSRRNLSFADSVGKVTAALAGEVEPLRRIGITVNENTLKMWASKNGIDANTQAWTEQQKIIGRVGVVMDGLKKDMGDLANTQGSVTNLLRSIGDQLREIVIAIFYQWRPAIQGTLTAVRDWLIDNRDTIAKWAGIVGAHFVYVKDIFVGFVKTMQQSPKEGFTVLMKALVETMKAAAEIAIDLSVRIGKGIWEGVREGIFGGPTRQQIEERANDLYRLTGGQYRQQKTPVGGFGQNMAYNRSRVPIDQAKFDETLRAAAGQLREEASQAISAPILAGFGEGAVKAIEAAGANIVAGTDAFKPYADQAAENLKAALQGIQEQFPDKSEAELAMEGWGRSMTEAGSAAETLRDKLKAMHQEAGTDGAKAIDEFTKRLQDEIKTMGKLNDVMLKGHSAYEREEMLQRLINEARQAGIKPTEQLTDALREYVEQMQALQQQQREAGGFWGGLRDLKNELPSLQEKLYDVGKAIREGIGEAFADAIMDAKDFGDAMKEISKQILRSLISWSTQKMVSGVNWGSVLQGIGGLFGGMAGSGTGASDINTTTPSGGMYVSRGGLVPRVVGAPVYAASGLFTPRGTDTVPAMLTPGEGVLDADTTSRLRRILQVQGGGSGGRTESLLGAKLDTLIGLTAQRQKLDIALLDQRQSAREFLESREGRRTMARNAGRER